jgi:CxxC-x17-CxxC domain-containing protein
VEEEAVRDFNRDSRGGDRRFGGGRDGGRREMHDTICSNCGKDCKVPFRPTGDKPVFCSECFGERGGNERRSSGRSDRYSSPRPRSGADNQQQFDDLNKKLDTIIDTLLYVKKSMKKDPVESIKKDLVELVGEDPIEMVEEKPKKKAKKKAKKTAKK